MQDRWKVGDEYRPFHPDASHVDARYREGWNDCFRAGGRRPLNGIDWFKVDGELLAILNIAKVPTAQSARALEELRALVRRLLA